MSLSELETLRRLRRHRADRAERTLREAKRQQQTLLAHIQHAEATLEQTRQQQALQSAQLLDAHQGQVVSLQALKSWAAKEHTLSADTRREEGRLQALHGQKAAQVSEVQVAQQQVSQCLRQVEKLQELSTLLAQEAS
ncbi:type III secretion protein [Pseudomonas kairouanensis]|uniref:Type III secretion protein n=1 Tax=Pseudomonas kairouanensis TaxID=2293832 RepID=A0A4Z0ALT2_9PSED|nr:YscO family type III secretion system apparatus protein [Pseudomonas kairouanensis]TFY86928.1 type III secretion protein [Pseudomonas kairouanensis]